MLTAIEQLSEWPTTVASKYATVDVFLKLMITEIIHMLATPLMFLSDSNTWLYIHYTP